MENPASCMPFTANRPHIVLAASSGSWQRVVAPNSTLFSTMDSVHKTPRGNRPKSFAVEHPRRCCHRRQVQEALDFAAKEQQRRKNEAAANLKAFNEEVERLRATRSIHTSRNKAGNWS